MEVIILAGGLGTRLRSVISEVPKCMAPVANKPFLWYLLKYLTQYEVSKVILSVGYLREVIYKWIDDVRDQFPFEFVYAVEEEPLGTGGGIKLSLTKATEQNVVVLNGDTFFNVDLSALQIAHNQVQSYITAALKPMSKFDRYGRVTINDRGQIVEFHEKQYCEDGLINGGVYIIDKDALSFDKLSQKFSFETAILEPQCKLGNLYGVVQNSYFIDIGIPEDYQKANIELTKYIL